MAQKEKKDELSVIFFLSPRNGFQRWKLSKPFFVLIFIPSPIPIHSPSFCQVISLLPYWMFDRLCNSTLCNSTISSCNSNLSCWQLSIFGEEGLVHHPSCGRMSLSLRHGNALQNFVHWSRSYTQSNAGTSPPSPVQWLRWLLYWVSKKKCLL